MVSLLSALLIWIAVVRRSSCFQTVVVSRCPSLLYASGNVDEGMDQLTSKASEPSLDAHFCSIMRSNGLSERNQDRILDHLQQAGILEDGYTLENLCLLAQDFVSRPEVFSDMLVKDFSFPPLVAHQTRALTMSVLIDRSEDSNNQGAEAEAIVDSEEVDYNKVRQDFAPEQIAMIAQTNQPLIHASTNVNGAEDGNEVCPVVTVKGDMTAANTDVEVPPRRKETVSAGVSKPTPKRTTVGVDSQLSNSQTKRKQSTLKQHIVNEKARKRRKAAGNYEYALPTDYELTFPKLGAEMADFYTFMTQPTTTSQEPPIRAATADVYLKHAKLFLGWHVNNKLAATSLDDTELSLHQIIDSKEKGSAKQIIEFVLWLRTRDISVSYEANLLRGLIKLLKYRFAEESSSDPAYGGNTFDDIPIIKEVRKLHRDANKRQRLAPRSSDEQMKWLSWSEFLQVIQATKSELLQLIAEFQDLPESKRKYRADDTEQLYCTQQKNVADAFQRYLILAIFASIPDRQRTIRELEIGRTLVKDKNSGQWIVKHGPDDYKTGKSYGERPPMQLSNELSPAIDAFLESWRPALRPSTEFLFVQAKTGKPFTRDSVFQRVSRCCFKHTGKRTNPHLLRDMIVTHVRESNASEKELEALALFMGHSLNMQRTSYDRRTLENKIAPAVNLINTVNKGTATT